MGIEPDCFGQKHLFERCDCADRFCTASFCIVCSTHRLDVERDALVVRYMQKVTDAIDMIDVYSCSEDADEHELSTYPASMAVLALLAQAEERHRFDPSDLREAIAHAIWESDESNTSSWGDAREFILPREVTYAAADAVIAVLREALRQDKE